MGTSELHKHLKDLITSIVLQEVLMINRFSRDAWVVQWFKRPTLGFDSGYELKPQTVLSLESV